ncbi:MAG: FAD-binding oxidoreductase [Oscillatoriales cyanobacterium RM2_1_1]|nr:FAD-binding oxidoreductase [Oscillatoriales cyanobacterium RM2_1_1]
MTGAIHNLDWDRICGELTGIEILRDRTQVAKLSQDYHHFSPILQSQLQGKVGDIVVRPTREIEVLKVARICVKYRIPLTVRGAGTGNYGQCVPLQGGVILDLSKMNQISWIKPGLACVEPGVKLAALDKQAQEIGWELRMVPSTYRTATIGGFVGGGSGGIGSINYGQLRDRGNLQAVRVVTMEEEPRVLELRGDQVQKVNHAYGTNGIITELEIPLAPAFNWTELIIGFDDFMTAARFGQALGESDGIVKKLICVCAWPIPSYFAAFREILTEQKHWAFVLIEESNQTAFQDLVCEFKGEVCYQKSAQDSHKGTTIIEYTWNHTTLHARSVNPSLTYLQTLFPLDSKLKLVEHCYQHFNQNVNQTNHPEVIPHLEFIRTQGKVAAAALQIVQFTTEERLNEIIQYHESRGALIFNPHTYLLEDGGMKTVNHEQLEFKQYIDPYGLLNPGKMRAWIDVNDH